MDEVKPSGCLASSGSMVIACGSDDRGAACLSSRYSRTLPTGFVNSIDSPRKSSWPMGVVSHPPPSSTSSKNDVCPRHQCLHCPDQRCTKNRPSTVSTSGQQRGSHPSVVGGRVRT